MKTSTNVKTRRKLKLSFKQANKLSHPFNVSVQETWHVNLFHTFSDNTKRTFKVICVLAENVTRCPIGHTSHSCVVLMASTLIAAALEALKSCH